MNDKRKRAILSVVGMVALLIVCVIGVQAVFAGLGMVSAQHGGVSSSQSAGSAQHAPSFCPFCGEGLPSSFQWGQFCPYCGEQVEA